MEYLISERDCLQFEEPFCYAQTEYIWKCNHRLTRANHLFSRQFHLVLFYKTLKRIKIHISQRSLDNTK